MSDLTNRRGKKQISNSKRNKKRPIPRSGSLRGYRATDPKAMPDDFDEQRPHDPKRSQAQIAGLIRLLAPTPKRVLDLGCGVGRVLCPLAQAGHRLTGVDRSTAALEQCQAELKSAKCAAQLIEADFTDPSIKLKRFDTILCLGNTFMTFVDVDSTTEWLCGIVACLKRDGLLVIDDFPFELWPELTGGNWQSGISDDGSTQLIWQPGDSVFALRKNDAVDSDNWEIGPHDRTFRLWCEGSLRLLARAAGLSAPIRLARAGLIIMGRGDGVPPVRFGQLA